jgi:hypothetical protein
MVNSVIKGGIAHPIIPGRKTNGTTPFNRVNSLRWPLDQKKPKKRRDKVG